MSDVRLFYLKGLNPQLVGYKDANYLSDPYKSWSQTEYLFFVWQHYYFMGIVKQTNIITIHEASEFNQNLFYTHELQKSGKIDIE